MKVLSPVTTVLVASVFATATAYAAAQAGGIEAGAVSGTATYVNAEGVRVQVMPGQKIPAGVLLETGPNSTLELFLSNGAKVVLQPGTQLRITNFTQDGNGGSVPTTGFAGIASEPTSSSLQLQLGKGGVVVDASRLNPLSQLQVKTPFITASTNSAVFSLEMAGARQIVNTVSGVVSVQQAATIGASINVPEGKSAVFAYSTNEQGELVVAPPVISNILPTTQETIVDAVTSRPVVPTSVKAPAVGEEPADDDEPFENIIDNSLPTNSPNGEGPMG